MPGQASLIGAFTDELYAYDQRIHGELKQRGEAELQSHPLREKANRGAGHAILLNSREWDSTAQILSATFNKPGAANASESGLRRHVAAFENADMSAHSKSVASENIREHTYRNIRSVIGRPRTLLRDNSN